MSDVTVQQTTGSVTVNFGVAGNVAGASAITILGRLAKVTATGTIGMANIAEGTVSGVLTLTKTGTTARTATFPDAAITVAGQGIDNAFSVGQTFANRIAIGGGALSTLGAVYIGGMTGVTSTNAIGFFLNAAYPSTATASCRGAQFSVTTAASTVVAEATGFLCASITKGSGGTITSCQSAHLTDQTNGTNNCALLISNAYTYTGNWAIRSESANASYLAGSLTVAGVVTVPNGTAAAPGIRTTTYAHGLYGSSTSLGVAVNGVASMALNAPSGSAGAGWQLLTAADADYVYLYSDRTNVEMRIACGSGTTSGANINLFGSTHATANTGSLRHSTTSKFTWNATGIGFFAATPVARPSLAAATGTATRTTFDTTTVTTAQLAERVKALIDDLRAYGLEG